MLNDDEYAAALLDADVKPGGPSLADWSSEVDMLAKVADLQQQLLRAFISANGGKGGRFVPVQRPETAMERARHRRQWAEYEDLMAMWDQLPDEPGGDDGA